MRLNSPNLFILASLAVAGPATASSIPNSGGDRSNNNGLITFELLSHKTVWERNRRERLLRRNLAKKNNEDEERHFSPDERVINTTQIDPTIQLDALYQGYGTHYVDLWVGTPTPQRQTVIVDTGSSITAFPCAGCKDCGKEYHTDDYFDYDESVTFQKLTCDGCNHGSCKRDNKKANPDGYCRIHQGYAEGSTWTAFEATDYVYAGGSHHEGVEVSVKKGGKEKEGKGVGIVSAPSSPVVERFETRLTFGCQTALTGLFKTQLADGIMGMGKNSYTFWSQMYSEGIIPKQRFSLCFSRQPAADRSGTHAGVMTMGGYDPRLHATPVAYAADVGGMSVQIQEMYLRRNGGESARGVSAGDDNLVSVSSSSSALNRRGGGGSIVDSGTTDTYFNRDLSKPFKKAWKEVTGRDYKEDDMELTDEQVEELPTIILRLKGAPLCDGCDDDLAGDGGGEDDDRVVTSRVSDEDTDEGGDAEHGKDAADADSSSPPDVFLAIPATHYLYYRSNSKAYGSRIYMDSSKTTLGANTMQGHDVFFDVENSRVGFAESDCDYSGISIYDDDEEDDEDEEDKENSEDVEEEGGAGDGEGTSSSSHSSSAGRGGTCTSMVCRASVGIVVVAFFVQLFVISKAWNYGSSFSTGGGVELSERGDSSGGSVDSAEDDIEAEERQPIIEDSEEI